MHDEEPHLIITRVVKDVRNSIRSFFGRGKAEERHPHEFGEVSLAFEVDIKMVDDEAIDAPPFKTDFHKSELYTTIKGKAEHYHFKHILLDVRSK